MVMNIVYSTVVACLVEVFLIANVSMITAICGRRGTGILFSCA